MYSRFYGLVELTDPICSENQNSAVVFEDPQKDCRLRSEMSDCANRRSGNIPDTRLFCTISPLVRSPRNTSASSSRRTQPHFLAKSKYDSKFFSTSRAVVPPMSPHVIGNKGRFVFSATHSAVEVLPAGSVREVVRCTNVLAIKLSLRTHSRHSVEKDD